MAKLIKQIRIPVTIEVLTGLHIGAGNDQVKIGGIDSPVVKLHLKDDQPYIPGSSLKGKIRSLLEYTADEINIHTDIHKFDPNECLDKNGYIKCNVCRFFGVPADAIKNEVIKTEKIIPIARFLFRDLTLDKESEKIFNVLKEDIEHSFYEEKIEVTISRKDGGATPRYIERVPAGTKFTGHIVLKIFDIDLQQYNLPNTEEGINTYIKEHINPLLDKITKLLENDYLGGQGSRGYGSIKIKFETNSINEN